MFETEIFKVIFLGIDGPLVTPNHLKMAIETRGHRGMEFDPACVANLKKIIEATDCKLIISSTWRIGYTVSGLRDLFNAYDLLGKYVIGKTPVIHDAPRGREIAQYLEDIKPLLRYQIGNFIIIDDDADMEPLMDHLVQTPAYQGITEGVVAKAIDMLGRSHRQSSRRRHKRRG